jgi:hypothetical protein
MEALIPMNWTEIHRHFTFLGLLQSFSAVVGIILVLWQIKGLSRSIKGVTQDNLYAHYTQIGNCLFQKPHLWPYFYENKTMSASDSTKTSLRAEIALMSEAILSLIEHAVLQKTMSQTILFTIAGWSTPVIAFREVARRSSSIKTTGAGTPKRYGK